LSNQGLNSVIKNKAHNRALQPALESMMEKTYTSKFTFIQDFKNKVAKVNDDFKSKKQWDKVIYTDYTFEITKKSSEGILTKQYWQFFLLSFTMILAGAFIYILSKYSKGPAGVKNNNIYHSSLHARGWIGIILGTLLIVFYIVLYWYPEYITNWVLMLDPISYRLNGGEASRWFLYGFLYTIAVLVMGIRMILKYRSNRYQMVRTMSVMFFQTAFAFFIPEILLALNKPWFDFKHIWPLNYSFFYDYNIKTLISNGQLGWFMLIWGTALSLIAVPVITYFYGKRWYCSWVCGCGGLAETLGDPFRQLSDKSIKAWKVERWMVHSVLVLVVVMTAITLINYFSNYKVLGSATETLHKSYGFIIGSVFSGVIGTGFYPLMGNRVWCRFGCPLAAYLGFIQRFKSRFRITTNGGQCISCGNCSTACEMGIDVRAYAQRGENIVRSSCVGCGICSAVCPRGVLKLENGGTMRLQEREFMIKNDGI